MGKGLPPGDKPFDLLTVLAGYARAHGIPLDAPGLVDSFATDAKERLTAALADAPLLHGMRIERLFEATVLSLGSYRLFKTEDIGRVHAAEQLRASDFRAVLEDGEQWLIEVKNVRCKEPLRQVATMTAPYLTSLQRYAESVDTPLRIALFWSTWKVWTVIDPLPFVRKNGGLRVTMGEAFVANDFSRLGDVMIMTKAPLRVLLGAATDHPRSLENDIANFIIGSAEIYADGHLLTDPRDRQLAEILLEFGDWPVEGPFAVMGDNGIAGVEFVAEPEETSDQGWDGIGLASRIFSRYFAERTIAGERVIQLHGEAVPDWFAPLRNWDFTNSELPLLLGKIQPNLNLLSGRDHVDD